MRLSETDSDLPFGVYAQISALCPLSFNCHRDAHAATDAQRGEAFLGVALLHLVEERHQHPPARRPDRVPERDRAAVDVNLLGVPAEVLVDGAGLRRKGFVGLDEIEV